MVNVDDCMHIYRGPKIRDKLNAALKDRDLPTPVIQQSSKGHDILKQRRLSKYPGGNGLPKTTISSILIDT